MNLKQRRELSRTERRARLAAAKETLNARALALRLSVNAPPDEVKSLMRSIDTGRSFGDLHGIYSFIHAAEGRDRTAHP